VDIEHAIQTGEDNTKAFFRQGQAHMALNDVEAAVLSFTKALEFAPNDVAIKKEMAAAKKKIAEKREQERKAFSRLFQ